jgi:DNA-binding PadR family transcriptional regulator
MAMKKRHHNAMDHHEADITERHDAQHGAQPDYGTPESGDTMHSHHKHDHADSGHPYSDHSHHDHPHSDETPMDEGRDTGRRRGGRRGEFRRRRREFAAAGLGAAFGPRFGRREFGADGEDFDPRFGPRFAGPEFGPEDDDEQDPGGFGHGGPRGPGRFGGPRRFGPGGFGPGGFGPGGFGPGGFGPGGPGGRGGRGGRGPGGGRGRRPRGNVRAAVLALLVEEPRHGYAIMTELAERSGGLWRPSPGSVYPVLQQLQDEGLVTAEESEGRKVFSITPAGRKLIEDSPAEFAEPWSVAGPGPRQRVQTLFEGMTALGSATQQVARLGSAEQAERARAVLDEARRALYRILAEDESTATRATSAHSAEDVEGTVDDDTPPVE